MGRANSWRRLIARPRRRSCLRSSTRRARAPHAFCGSLGPSTLRRAAGCLIMCGAGSFNAGAQQTWRSDELQTTHPPPESRLRSMWSVQGRVPRRQIEFGTGASWGQSCASLRLPASVGKGSQLARRRVIAIGNENGVHRQPYQRVNVLASTDLARNRQCNTTPIPREFIGIGASPRRRASSYAASLKSRIGASASVFTRSIQARRLVNQDSIEGPSTSGWPSHSYGQPQ
jgi:hypothetical protein